MLIVGLDLVLLAGQGNLTIPPFAKYTPQPASPLLNTHHSSISLVAADEKILKKIFFYMDHSRVELAVGVGWVGARRR
jgi:hypothetical protein